MTEETRKDTQPDKNANGRPDEKKPKIKPIDPPREPEREFLELDALRIFRDASGRVRAALKDDRSHLDVRVIRCFPQSIPDRFWALTHQDGRVIGVIVDPDALDEESLEASLYSLEQQYFLPQITAVHSLKEEFGAIYFEVDTDRGQRSFVAKGVREALEETSDGEIILTDVNENRYAITNYQNLDSRSRRFLDRII